MECIKKLNTPSENKATIAKEEGEGEGEGEGKGRGSEGKWRERGGGVAERSGGVQGGEGEREEGPAPQSSPKPLPRVPKQPNPQAVPQKKGSSSTDAISKVSKESQDIPNESSSVSSTHTVEDQPLASATSMTVIAGRHCLGSK